MNNTKPPDPFIKQSMEQHLQVYEVKPVGNIPAQFRVSVLAFIKTKFTVILSKL